MEKLGIIAFGLAGFLLAYYAVGHWNVSGGRVA